jgi:hypothetical protein
MSPYCLPNFLPLLAKLIVSSSLPKLLIEASLLDRSTGFGGKPKQSYLIALSQLMGKKETATVRGTMERKVQMLGLTGTGP